MITTLHELADAMRCGAKIRPQGYGVLFDFFEIPGQVVSCAMGAVIEAAGYVVPGKNALPDIDDLNEESFIDRDLLNMECKCPENSRYHSPKRLDNCIYHLNDNRGWSREAIAAWIESLAVAKEAEKAEEAKETEEETDNATSYACEARKTELVV